jgi:hypothetical protein
LFAKNKTKKETFVSTDHIMRNPSHSVNNRLNKEEEEINLGEEEEPPNWFLCLISMEVMQNAVVAADGMTCTMKQVSVSGPAYTKPCQQ